MSYMSGLDWGPEDTTTVNSKPRSQNLLRIYWISALIFSHHNSYPFFFFGYCSEVIPI